MVTPNGELIFESEYEDKCELCGTTFELRYYHNRLVCTECKKYLKEQESTAEE